MPYLGKTPSQATRKRYYKTASGSETSISGTMTVGGTLTFTDGEFVDVSVNGVALVAGTDYNTSTANTIAGLSALTANAGVVVDNITIDGTEIDLSSGNLTIDVAGQIILDADTQGSGNGVLLKDGGTLYGSFFRSSSDLHIKSEASDEDMLFMGNDGGTEITALTLDMSAAGAAAFNAGATFADTCTITTADNTSQLILKSTDADDSGGPGFDLLRDSSSPANSDDIGYIRFRAKNSNGDEHTYGFFQAKALTVTDGSEDGGIELLMNKGGSNRSRMEVLAGETVFNEDSVDVDFRVESDLQMAAFFVEGSTGNISIGHNTPILDSSIAGTSVPSGTKYVHVNDGDGAVIKLTDPADSANRGAQFAIINTTAFLNNCESGGLILGSGNTGVMTISGSQDTAFFRSGGVVVTVNRGSDDGTLVNFQQASTSEGNISVSGNTVSYNAFSGSHWSRLADNSKPTILRGTVIETIDQMCTWYQAEYTYNGEDKSESIALPAGKSVGDTFTYETTTLDPNEKITVTAKIVEATDVKHSMCKISDTADSKKVYGVFLDWDNDEVDEVNDMYVCAVGTNLVRVHKDVTVEAGDLLSSNGDGTAKVQDDDIIRSKTIGKVTAAVKQETYSDGSYTVPCALYCGQG